MTDIDQIYNCLDDDGVELLDETLNVVLSLFIRANNHERRLFYRIIKTIVKKFFVGQKKYGHLNPNDGRDWRRETLDEAVDTVFYSTLAVMDDERP